MRDHGGDDSSSRHELESDLRAARPRAPRALADRLAAAAGLPPASSGRRRAARRLVVLASALGLLAGLGGLSYAGALGSTAASVVKVGVVHTGIRQVAVRNAASDVYSTTRNTTTGDITLAAQPVLKLDSQQAPSTVAATLRPATASATANLTLTVEAVGTPSAGFGGGSNSGIFVKVVATNTTTKASVTTLPAPLEIVISNPPAGFSPAYSTDGVTFRAIPSIAPRTALADGEQDGWFLRGSDVVILTRHLTIFGMVRPELITVTAAGAKRPAAGSGKFGDITRSKPSAPVLALESVGLAKSAKTSPVRILAVRFSINEQAAVYFSVIDPRGREVQILRSSSGIRGRQLTGGWVKYLHTVVLSPATMTAGVAASKRQLAQGGSFIVVVTAVDFDGNKTTKKIPIVIP